MTDSGYHLRLFNDCFYFINLKSVIISGNGQYQFV